MKKYLYINIYILYNKLFALTPDIPDEYMQVNTADYNRDILII